MNKIPETHSLLGEPLYSHTAVSEERRPELEKALEEARANLGSSEAHADLVRVAAKSLAALHRFREAQALLSQALATASGDNAAWLYCDRGHYYVNLREFDKAKEDLLQAAELGLDEFDVWYHLALAYWFSGDNEAALSAFLKCYETALDDSHRVAITDWLFVCLNRLGRLEEAEPLLASIHADMIMTGNNHLYLKQLLFYKGELTVEEMDAICAQGGLALTNNYTMGLWYRQNGSEDKAMECFRRVVEQGTVWGAFGHIGAEAELARSVGNDVADGAD